MKAIRCLLALGLMVLFVQAAAAQNDWAPEATKQADKGEFFLAGNEAVAAAATYEGYARRPSNPEVNYSRALECYLRAADYYDKDKEFSLSPHLRDQALANANRIYQLMHEKGYDVSDQVEVDRDRLKKPEPVAPPEEKPAAPRPPADASSISTEGNRVVFKSGDDVFSMSIPPPFKPEELGRPVPVYTEAELRRNLANRGDIVGYKGYGIGIVGYQIGIEFGRLPPRLLKIAPEAFPDLWPCEPEGKQDDRTFERGSETMQLGPIKACLRYYWTWEIDNPIQSKEDLTAAIKIEFDFKEARYTLGVGVRNFDEVELQKHVMAMVRSFRYEGDGLQEPEPPSAACTPDGKKQLLDDLALPITWEVLDLKRDLFTVQEPILGRREVPAVWERWTGELLGYWKLAKDGKRGYDTATELAEDGATALTLGRLGWRVQNLSILKISFFPVDLDELSVGGVTNWVTFYLEGMNRATNRIGEVEKQLTGMASNLYWEVPYTEIQGQCIPQRVCVDGAWKTDYDRLAYRETSRNDEKKYKAENPGFRSVRQVQTELDEQFYTRVEKLEKNLVAYNDPEADRCRPVHWKLFTRELYDGLERAGRQDQCAYLRAKRQYLETQIGLTRDVLKEREQDLADWLKQKPDQLRALNAKVKEVEDALAATRATIKGLKEDRRVREQFFEENEGSFPEIEKKLKEIEAQLTTQEATEAGLVKERQRLTKELGELNDVEKEKQARIRDVEQERTRLAQEKEAVNQQLSEECA